jgi:hypothetical protein
MKPNNKKIMVSILLVAFFLRMGMLWINAKRHPSFFQISTELVQKEMKSSEPPYVNSYGNEISNVAYSLVCKKQGLASPFGGSTGPTGWVAPGLVLIYALSFYLFGCFSLGSLIFMLALSILLSLIMVFLIYLTSLQLFNSRSTAYLCSFLFAVCPQDVWLFSKNFQQDFNLYTFLFVLIFFLFLRFIKSRATKNLILFSLVAAIALHFTPVLAIPVAVCITLFVLKDKTDKTYALKQAILCCIIIFMIITPYIIYQKYRLGSWTFIKSNAVYEINLGNTRGYAGVLVLDLFRKKHPAANRFEFQSYKTMGEVNYVRSKLTEFLDNFNLLRFIKLTIKRFFCFYLIYVPYVSDLKFTVSLFLKYVGYSISGLSMILYLFLRFRNMDWFDALIYFYILAYSVPYVFGGIMYRYSFPICTLTTILLGKSLWLLFGSKDLKEGIPNQRT